MSESLYAAGKLDRVAVGVRACDGAGKNDVGREWACSVTRGVQKT